MKRMLPVALVASAFFAIAGSEARAASIDFRDSTLFGAAHGQPSHTQTVGDVTLTLEPAPEGALLWWDGTDGVAVQFDYESDEVEGREILRIVFERAVVLEKVHIADLFHEHGYLETGFYDLGDGPVGFQADPGQLLGSTNGELTLILGAKVRAVAFTAPGRIDGEHHEFAVRGLEATPAVPEPSAFVLFGTGFALLGYRFWRRPHTA